VDPKEIEQSFANAGWELDGGFSGYLVIGYNRDGLSILAPEEACETDGDPIFELVDHERNVTYRVQEEIPTPQQARELLQEHGKSPEEWDD